MCHSRLLGSSILKIVPFPSSEDLTHILPLWYSSTILFANERPSPQPRFLVVNPGWKTLCKFFLAMPFPVSATSIATFAFSSNRVTVIRPLPSIASTAFLQRFSTTHSNNEAFIFTMTGSSGITHSMITFFEVRWSMYSTTCITTSFMFDATGSGKLPIFENLSAMSCKRFTSLSISGIRSLSG